jgi:hypothetical protein
VRGAVWQECVIAPLLLSTLYIVVLQAQKPEGCRVRLACYADGEL